MVALNPRFTVLALFCIHAALTFSPSPVKAVVLDARADDGADEPSHTSRHDASATKTGGPIREQTPVMPLPNRVVPKSGSGAGKKQKVSTEDVHASEHKGEGQNEHGKTKKGEGKHHEARLSEVIPFARILALANMSFGHDARDVVEEDGDLLDVDVPGIIAVSVGETHQAHFHTKQARGESVSTGIHRRSSVVIPNNHGGEYVVTHARRSPDRDHDHDHYHHHHHGHRNHKNRQDFYSKRNEASTGVPGTVGIMSPVDGSAPREVASLVLDKSNGTDVLNASDTNHTEIWLVKDSGSPECAGLEAPIYCAQLQIPFFDAPTASLVMRCVTFDPSPPKAEPLTVMPCFNSTSSTEKGPHQSQTFSYDSSTGVIHPMWYAGEDDGKTDTTTASSDTAAVDGVDPTPDSAGVASATGVNVAARQESGSNSGAQNVTLVFLPRDPESASVKAEEEASDTIVTSTATETVTVTVTGAGTDSIVASSSVDSLAAAEASTTTDSMSTLLTSTALTSVTETASSSVAALETLSTSSTDSSAPTSTSLAVLDVEVVAPTASASSSETSTSPAPTTVNAEAIASSIASAHAASSSDSAAASTASTLASTVPSAAAMDIVSSSSSASPTMTPVSTAPYEWMFKAESRL